MVPFRHVLMSALGLENFYRSLALKEGTLSHLLLHMGVGESGECVICLKSDAAH